MREKRRSIWWLRRDLRLADNPSLNASLAESDTVIPLFILDPHLLSHPAEKRKPFLFAALSALDRELRCRGSCLIVREGEPLEQLTRLVQETGAKVIFAEADTSPYARRRDGRIMSSLPLRLISGMTIHPPDLIHKPDGRPYAVFTAFSKTWKALPFQAGNEHPLPSRFPPVPDTSSLVLPEAPHFAGFPATDAEAQRRLADFLAGPVYSYAENRNRMDLDGTSRLSPYFRFGLISARQAAKAVGLAFQSCSDEVERLGCDTWLNELIWREFYISILFHHPNVLKGAYQPAYRNIPWRDSSPDLNSWQQGLTGYPVVDAAMRQLLETGWMHNRARMIVASFLVKNLLINWQAGEAWFMRHLVDADPASNNGGWQWTAGVGTDAAPYFRIFNPVSQSQKHDPHGEYIKRYVPDLRQVPPAYIHAPWLMPDDIQAQANCRIGVDYPAPIVDTSQTKERTLRAYQLSKKVEVQ